VPILRVEIWSGRNEELKKSLAKALTDVMVEKVGCPAQAVTIIFDEVPKENWVIGGQSCRELFEDTA
jgi:4-oxalocrotonate tautomerase